MSGLDIGFNPIADEEELEKLVAERNRLKADLEIAKAALEWIGSKNYGVDGVEFIHQAQVYKSYAREMLSILQDMESKK